MQFGKTNDIDSSKLFLPNDAPQTIEILQSSNELGDIKVHIGCPQWSKAALKNFYPRGTKEPLAYYSSQFNSIELNAFYYRIFPPEVVQKWVSLTPKDFRFFPKIPQVISQFRRLKNCSKELDSFYESISHFGEKLGGVFLQMPDNYHNGNFEDLRGFLENWVEDIPLFVELRNESWYSDKTTLDKLCDVLQNKKIGHVLTDTPARRDLLHMRLTIPSTFIRFTGANHPSDFVRLNEWFEKLDSWKSQGLQEINFFIHQEVELDLFEMAKILAAKMREKWGVHIRPQNGNSSSITQTSLL